MAKKNFKGGLGGILGNNSASLELTILPELKDFIPPLSEEERKLLKESIEKEGIKEPLDIWINDEKAIIIDGHNRYSLATELNAKYTTKEHDFSNIKEVKEWMLRKQLGRRNLTDKSRTFLLGLLYNKAKQDIGSYDRDKKTTSNTAQSIAEQTGTSVRSVHNAGEFATGMEKLAPELKEHVLGGKEKVTKSDIQQLASSDVEKPIENVEEIKKEVLKVEEKKNEKKEKKKKSVKKKDDTPFEPLENFQKEYDKTGSKDIDKASNEAKNDGLSDAEHLEHYSNTQDKFNKTFADSIDDVLVSVLNDFLAHKGSMSDNIKLAKAGFTILRIADAPSIHIKHFTTENNSWKTLENGFKSKAARDRRFRELLEDDKTIQG